MAGFNDIKMKPKLIGLFLLVGLVPLIIVGFLSLNKARVALDEAAFAELEAVQAIKANQVSRFFNQRMGDVETYAHNETVRQAATEL